MNEEHPVVVNSVDAAVNAERQVTLWRGGQTISVPESTAAILVRDGWVSNNPEDIDAVLNEIKLFSEQVLSNIWKFVEEVRLDGCIDPHDGSIYEASLTAKVNLDKRVYDLLTIVHALYPMRQGVAVRMKDVNGDIREIDPGQVKEYLAQGWSRI